MSHRHYHRGYWYQYNSMGNPGRRWMVLKNKRTGIVHRCRTEKEAVDWIDDQVSRSAGGGGN